MKNKIFGAAFIIVLAVVATLNINLNKSKNSNGDLAMVNVEALAGAEQIIIYCTVETTCFNYMGKANGKVSCTGTICSRDSESVTCNGHKTEC